MTQAHSNFYRLLLIGIGLLIVVLAAAAYALAVNPSLDPVAGASVQWRASLALLAVTLTAVIGMLIAYWRIVLLPMRALNTLSGHLEALYAFSSFLADASPKALNENVIARILEILQADAIALRFCGNGESAFEVLMNTDAGAKPAAAACLAASARTVTAQMAKSSVQRVLPDESPSESVRACHTAGMRCLIYVPVRSQQRVLAEIVLYFQNVVALDEAREALIDVITRHLAICLDSQHARALDRESAVSAERHLIARELHDSIAQSLGFLKIQIHLLRKAIDKQDQDMAAFALSELDTGLSNSIADVRELLLHFRTRTVSGDIEAAIQETLQKFRNQSGLKTYFDSRGDNSQLAPDVQNQFLNILQESLSNIRKHAAASRVDVELVRGRIWRLVVRDDGRGFDTGADKTIFNVGLKIMSERAEMIGATLALDSVLGSGTTVTLSVPQTSATRPALPAVPDTLAAAAATAAAQTSSAQSRELVTSKT